MLRLLLRLFGLRELASPVVHGGLLGELLGRSLLHPLAAHLNEL